MPIFCPLKIKTLSTAEFRSLDYQIMSKMYESQNELGRLADEQVYIADVSKRLEFSSFPCSQEVSIELTHKDFTKNLYLDLVVSNQAVYELKAVKNLTSNHICQLLTYLYLLDLPRGKIVNFRSSKVESRFVNAPISRKKRFEFSVRDNGYRGSQDLKNIVTELVLDWGTALSITHYHQAIVHLLGGIESVECMLPLIRDGQHIANQRFHIAENKIAFKLTAFEMINKNYASQLQRLLLFSPLRQIHWININPQCLSFLTIEKT